MTIENQDLPDFVRGMMCAYKDCADQMRHIAKGLPKEAYFVSALLEEVAETITEKSKNAAEIAMAHLHSGGRA